LGTKDCNDIFACCRQINLTPRRVKRLINVLKLIKIFWFRKHSDELSRDVKQTVIGLLALSACYPEIMREAFVELDTQFRAGFGTDSLKISKFFNRWKKTLDSQNPIHNQLLERFHIDVKALLKVKIDQEEQPLSFFDITLDRLSFSTFNLVRSFSFVGDPSYEMEGTGTEEKEIAPEQLK